MLLFRNHCKESAWHKAAERGNVAVLKNLWNWAKKMQVKPEELRNELCLSKDGYKRTTWHNAAKGGHVEILKKVWAWAKELQL